MNEAVCVQEIPTDMTADSEELCHEARDAVICGIKQLLTDLRVHNKGRFDTNSRITSEAVLAAAVYQAKVKGVAIKAIGELLHQDVHALHRACSRVAAVPEGGKPLCFVPAETSCGAYDSDWTASVRLWWEENTRQSECTKDVASNPFKDPVTGKFPQHRIHWLETRITDLLDTMCILGRREYGSGFHLSERKMVDLKPFYVKIPGRETCLCRYHMAFEHRFNALRRWKQLAHRDVHTNPAMQCADCMPAPTSAAECRQRLCCPRGDSVYYRRNCCERSCSDCNCNLDTLTTSDERAARPRISFMQWTSCPYTCKDGREVPAFDFVEAEVPIETFLKDTNDSLGEFLPHHNRAKWLDNDWSALWNHVSAKPNRFATVMDYANSYTHLLKNEHMQRFWVQPTTTIFGCVLKIAVAHLSDDFFKHYPETGATPDGQPVYWTPAQQRAELLRTLEQHGHPPEITIMHALLTPNPHHDTAGVQHFFHEQLYPWLWANTVDLEQATHYARSDGCGGQFKSGRHFRFISNFSQSLYNKDVRLIWSHFESCHGKDLSDPECGRLKYILYKQEMRHTHVEPTEMKTTAECYQYLVDHHTRTNR